MQPTRLQIGICLLPVSRRSESSRHPLAVNSCVTSNPEVEALGLTEQLRHGRPTKLPTFKKAQRYRRCTPAERTRLSRTSRGCTKIVHWKAQCNMLWQRELN